MQILYSVYCYVQYTIYQYTVHKLILAYIRIFITYRILYKICTVCTLQHIHYICTAHTNYALYIHIFARMYVTVYVKSMCTRTNFLDTIRMYKTGKYRRLWVGMKRKVQSQKATRTKSQIIQKKRYDIDARNYNTLQILVIL